jgi:uncharacterized protein YndB with AHSA1/START domain
MQNLFWKIHLRSNIENVFEILTTDAGREKFWAEKSIKDEHKFTLTFPNGDEEDVMVIFEKDYKFEFVYFRTIVSITLTEDGKNGTDLVLNCKNIKHDDYVDMASGWVSVLLALKAAVDYNIDIRNHDLTRTWDEGYVDN